MEVNTSCCNYTRSPIRRPPNRIKVRRAGRLRPVGGDADGEKDLGVSDVRQWRPVGLKRLYLVAYLRLNVPRRGNFYLHKFFGFNFSIYENEFDWNR